MDGLTAIAIDDGNSEDCAKDAVGGYIAAIDAVAYINCADLTI